MKAVKEIFRVCQELRQVLPVLLFFKPPGDHVKESMGRLFQETAARYHDKPAIIFEGRELTWGQFNALVNQIAHLLKQQGVKRGDAVSLLMENRIEMLASVVAVAKLGAVVGLINTSLTGGPLVHCINITESTKCLVGEEMFSRIEDVKNQLGLADSDYLWVKDSGVNSVPAGALDVIAELDAMPTSNPPETTEILAGEKACYIFTSGTTGLPKAAVIYHRRYLSAAQPYCKVGMRAKQTDRIYLCLPLYHMTGLGPGVGASFVSGASIFLRRRFSASQFWPEVQQYQTNLFVYVGELCRYLAMHPECPEEKNNPLQTMLGNGLRPDVWDVFKDRFQVERISEIYGSSEGNATFINVLNKNRTIGTSAASIMLVKYDVDADEMMRDTKGQLMEAEPGEPGLLIAEIDDTYQFDGYKNQQASESKILRDVRKTGDSWFNTGDLIRKIDVGFTFGLPHFQFVDRVGDTFRWRAENVSTNEVGEILNASEQIEIANVYGVEVPGVEGKAGMAALTLKPGATFDDSAFSAFAQQELPAYARPVFVRIQSSAETTVTFKLFKGKLRKEAYHLDQVEDPIYVLKPGAKAYEPLDQPFYQQIVSGQSGY